MASPYSPHPSLQSVRDWVDALKVKSGRTLQEWMEHIAANGPRTEAARREWLKRECKFGTNSAWWLAERSVGKGSEDDSPEAYLKAAQGWVDAMYEKKPNLLPLHEAILECAKGISPEVKACPCQSIVPLYRTHVFAQIKPAARNRLDLGLCLTPLVEAGEELPPRLVSTGGYEKKDRITHRIELATVEDFNGEARKWLRKAFTLDKKVAGKKQAKLM